MYSVFSAWKLYSKERSLLKRYLIDCGRSTGELSCMTTMQLRDEAEKRKSQSRNNNNFTDMSGSVLQKINTSGLYDPATTGSAQEESPVKKAAPRNIALSLRKDSIPSRSGFTVAVPTPSFLRESLPEGSMRTRYVSPDIVQHEAAAKGRSEFRSAEQAHSRKKSNSVLTILQKQFGER